MSARDDYPADFETDDLLIIAGQFDRACDEIDRLRAWKAEAMLIMAEWDEVWETAGRPGLLGKSKARIIQQVLLDNERER